MQPELKLRHRVLVTSYRRYLVAEQAWSRAVEDAARWFPAAARASAGLIGNPGSRIRALYEEREEAIQRLAVARLKLEIARQRMARRKMVMARMRRLLPGPV